MKLARYMMVGWALATVSAHPARATTLTVAVTGSPSILFDTARDGCAPGDMPDVNPRAYRDASGAMVMFALHDANRPLRGPDLSHLTLDCRVALPSPEDGDPARYADRNFITATWTDDGRDVAALVHEEYHADHHGRCRFADDLPCWTNTILAYGSRDGGATFTRTRPFVVAAAPFRQDVGQGRHRGFFNPSNIVAIGGARYAMIVTTGWDGQPAGTCLFRAFDPRAVESKDEPDQHGSNRHGWEWRAWDGAAFTVRFEDPYAARTPTAKPCVTIEPFAYAVGSIVRHRATGTWIAVLQARSGGAFPVDGFYVATSHDLLHWSPPTLLLAGRTLYDDLCTAGPTIIGYPTMLDAGSPTRNFDEVGDHPDLLFTTMAVSDCHTGRRMLLRRGLTVSGRAG